MLVRRLNELEQKLSGGLPAGENPEPDAKIEEIRKRKKRTAGSKGGKSENRPFNRSDCAPARTSCLPKKTFEQPDASLPELKTVPFNPFQHIHTQEQTEGQKPEPEKIGTKKADPVPKPGWHETLLRFTTVSWKELLKISGLSRKFLPLGPRESPGVRRSQRVKTLLTEY